jgi:hypothetical protein
MEIDRLTGKSDNVNFYQRTLETELSQLRAEQARL